MYIQNYSKLRVAFKQCLSSYTEITITEQCKDNVGCYIDSLEALVRKRISGLMELLNNSDNTIIKCINNSWILRFDIWSPWNDLLYIHVH